MKKDEMTVVIGIEWADRADRAPKQERLASGFSGDPAANLVFHHTSQAQLWLPVAAQRHRDFSAPGRLVPRFLPLPSNLSAFSLLIETDLSKNPGYFQA